MKGNGNIGFYVQKVKRTIKTRVPDYGHDQLIIDNVINGQYIRKKVYEHPYIEYTIGTLHIGHEKFYGEFLQTAAIKRIKKELDAGSDKRPIKIFEEYVRERVGLGLEDISNIIVPNYNRVGDTTYADLIYDGIIFMLYAQTNPDVLGGVKGDDIVVRSSGDDHVKVVKCLRSYVRPVIEKYYRKKFSNQYYISNRRKTVKFLSEVVSKYGLMKVDEKVGDNMPRKLVRDIISKAPNKEASMGAFWGFLAAKQAEYKVLYGDNWSEHYNKLFRTMVDEYYYQLYHQGKI